MRARVQRWGNSLALRIPRAFAAETAIDHGSDVELTLEHGELVVTPVAEQGFSLGTLLDGITPENAHAEVESGSPQGGEAW